MMADTSRPTYRQQLLKGIRDFDANLPMLIRENPQDGQFITALTLVVENIVSDADPGEQEWIRGQLKSILFSYRILPF